MKIEVSFLVILLIAPILIAKASATELDSNNAVLPSHKSEKPFAWFHDWVVVVEEAPGRYAAEKKRAEDLRAEFNEHCHKAYLIGQDDKVLIDRWCKHPEWKEFKLDSTAMQDDDFKKELEQLKKQISFSEMAFTKYGGRDVNNAFDRAKGASANFKMNTIEQDKFLPYLSGVDVARENYRMINKAMDELDEQLIAKRKNEYQAELNLIEKERIEKENKRVEKENVRLKSEKDALYAKQKIEADLLIEDACNAGRDDALRLNDTRRNLFKSKSKMLDMVAGLEESISSRYTDCYNTELVALSCKQAAEDYMKCGNGSPPSEYLNLAKNNKAQHDLEGEYVKCYAERKKLYSREKTERKKSLKTILKYGEVYREKGGYFITDYNECVDSAAAALTKLPRKARYAMLSKGKIRSCEDESRLVDDFVSRSCSCTYGVIADTLDEREFTKFSGDILTLIKFSHSSLGNKNGIAYDEKKFEELLRHPEESYELFMKASSECAM